jgi:hypothetical protein
MQNGEEARRVTNATSDDVSCTELTRNARYTNRVIAVLLDFRK